MSDQSVQPRLRIGRVEVDTRRHTVSYHMGGGYRLLICFVSNLRRPGQTPLYLYVDSIWLVADNGTRLLGGVLHNPEADESSSTCYFYAPDGLAQEELRRYTIAVKRQVLRTWGLRRNKGPDLRWLSRKTTLEGWQAFCERLGEETPIDQLPAVLVSKAVPKIS